MRRELLGKAILLTFCTIAGAQAEESLVPTAESGDWVALEHRESMTDRADVCLALNIPTGVAFRSDGTSVQIRVMNKSWSLPVSVRGALIVSVSEWKQSFDINDNTANMVNAEVPEEAATALFLKMDHASTMHVTAGTARPIDVSLSGSTRVTNAFRTCAGIDGNASSPGSNPFQ